MIAHFDKYGHCIAASTLVALASLVLPAPARADEAAPTFDLTRATLPPTGEPQPFQLEVTERRETTLADGTTTTQRMSIILAGKLRRDREPGDGTVEATLLLTRIQVTLESLQPVKESLTYDSAADPKSQAHSLAELMSAVRDAELSLVVGPDGTLRSLHGLDARWSEAKVLVARPALMGVQLQFRDAAMKELISEALFPPMPARPLGVGGTWDARVPVSLPAAALLVSKLHHRIGGAVAGGSPEQAGAASVEAEGVIENAPPILPGIEASLRSRVRSSRHHVKASLHPERHELSQVSERELALELQQVPPEGGDSLTLTIQQTRRLWAARGEPARRRPAP